MSILQYWKGSGASIAISLPPFGGECLWSSAAAWFRSNALSRCYARRSTAAGSSSSRTRRITPSSPRKRIAIIYARTLGYDGRRALANRQRYSATQLSGCLPCELHVAVIWCAYDQERVSKRQHVRSL